MPERVQLRRTKGWRMPPNTVRVSRPSEFGNPFLIHRLSAKRWDAEVGAWLAQWEVRGRWQLRGKVYPDEHAAAAAAVARFREHCPPDSPLAEAARRVLRGKDLACWCPLDRPCHADVLLEIANAAGA